MPATQSGTWPKTDGDSLYSSDLNYKFNPIMHYYSGTAMDGSIGSPTVSFTGSYVAPFIPPGSLFGANFLRIGLNAQSSVQADSDLSVSSSVSFKTQYKGSGGSWADIGNGETTLATVQSTPSQPMTVGFYNMLHPLSTLEKVSGTYIMGVVTLTLDSPANDQNASFSNRQFYIELI